MNDAICCQLSMRSKGRVGALAACGVRDDGREDPSLPALHRVWPVCHGGIGSLSLLCVGPFLSRSRLTNLVLGIATYNKLFCLTSEILREYSKTSVTSLLGSMALVLDIGLNRLCNRVRIIRTQYASIFKLLSVALV